ncbi:DUF3006 domain-containing protein [Candidatus Palauibacter sp.]|uniref:DUF3006 domain-containing protein n=1 Tax=Candidatus Palauibacter sp. TaxID=3101350 RepID=UPI003B017005
MNARTERRWVVDRVEESIAVLVRDEDEHTEDVPISALPAGSREGSVLRVPELGGRADWTAAALDEEARRARLREAEEVLERLRLRDPGGDIKL